ncbi:hypothetical protein [Paenibacillus validus]|uniref:hypothetical protein n=1 Tax=Paenibacillus validus TaxID=44253 RepID=UPI003D2ABFF5
MINDSEHQERVRQSIVTNSGRNELSVRKQLSDRLGKPLSLEQVRNHLIGNDRGQAPGPAGKGNAADPSGRQPLRIGYETRAARQSIDR